MRQQAISYSGTVSSEITFELLKYTLTALIAGESLVISTETAADNHEILVGKLCIKIFSISELDGNWTAHWDTVTNKLHFLVVKKQLKKKEKKKKKGNSHQKLQDNCYSLKL